VNGDEGGEFFRDLGEGGRMPGEHSPHNCILPSNQEVWRMIMMLNGHSDNNLGDEEQIIIAHSHRRYEPPSENPNKDISFCG
jgi:hypothetical protein